MTEIPKEFPVNEDTIEEDFPPGPLAEHLNLVKKKNATVDTSTGSDFPPDGCGIGIGSSYRDM